MTNQFPRCFAPLPRIRKWRITFNRIQVIWLQSSSICDALDTAKTKKVSPFSRFLVRFSSTREGYFPARWSVTALVDDCNVKIKSRSFCFDLPRVCSRAKLQGKLITQWALSKLQVICNRFNFKLTSTAEFPPAVPPASNSALPRICFSLVPSLQCAN